ncbi:FAD-binding oxidoreductase [Actinoplanes sp. TBRC 11911]|uniref:styrene monooxygenase/indole monooxygenase family protein n=1 Tax=Actinoplanes sp. TBRC 11911 TaxID=2729386 RepID=UPI00145F4E2A|nr:styrene monooxygenase/indole monooxygenase family protein [Actinoplanes sp. TBRC 11911]NMO57705.1 FAD-binding oxidoreductase [Actinoplanes sp. TBRC 11911]
MRSILIVGAGQSGLQLGLGLLAEGYDVTIMSARTADEIRHGWPTSTQVMFEPALSTERRYGLELWESQTPAIAGLRIGLHSQAGGPSLSMTGSLSHPARSTDQRLKLARWLELAEQRGAHVVYSPATAQDLDQLASRGNYDLTVVAAGRGDLTAIFERDASRSPYQVPQRGLAAAYVHGLQPSSDRPEVELHAIPGLGELFVIPALGINGPCHILFWEAVPDSPLDRWHAGPSRISPTEHLGLSLDAIKAHLPSVYERCRYVELADGKATLRGRFAPTVRRAVAALPGGGHVLGMADVVITNDPLTGQGANNAAKCADHYLRAIVAHGDQQFDEPWMRQTSDDFWTSHGRTVTEWTNLMLQPPPHVQQVLYAATQYPAIADRLANGFTDPNDFVEWFMTPEKAAAYLHSMEVVAG